MKNWKKIVLLFLVAFLLTGCGTQQPEETAAQTVPTTAATQPPQIETVPPVLPEPTTAEMMAVDAVPHYFQTDYPHLKFGNGTIGTSGCSITCLAMVATYLTDQEYLPDQMAYHFGSYGKNNIERLEYGIQQLGLPYEKNFDWQITKQGLREGKVAIVMVNGRSPFTTQQHFIVLTGLTEDGAVMVNDPYGPNYENITLAEKYENGFPEYEITSGLCGAWVFDKTAMPENAELYNAEKPESDPTRYEGVEPTGEDIYLLACFAWAEAREQPYEVQQAVLEVVLNRMVSEDFPNTVKGVISSSDLAYAAKQMQHVEEPELEQYMAVTGALYGPHYLPKDVVYYSGWSEEGREWGKIGDYTFFYSR